MQEYFQYIAIAFVLFLISFKKLNEYEEALVFRINGSSRVIKEGFFLTIPGFERVFRVDTRVQIEEVEFESLHLVLNIFLQVVDTESAILKVPDYKAITVQVTRDLFAKELVEIEKDQVNEKLEEIMPKLTNKISKEAEIWGVKIIKVEARRNLS